MRAIFLYFLLLIGVSTNISAQTTSIDSMAFKIVKDHLNKIAGYLKATPDVNKSSSSDFHYRTSVDFLTNLTGIDSEADGNFAGRFPPTKNDLKRWTFWLFRNEAFIAWDAVNRSITIKKTVELIE